ncbi:MAG: efflux RND transporter periplasmic adaptor subunit [Ignavibacteriales bacterium]|nr:efflux RND transporter periplasmic adaptor subunit [Ignavibacteriales bacterium]
MHFTKKSYLLIGSVILLLTMIFIVKIASGDSSKRPIPQPVVELGEPAIKEIQKSETLTGDVAPIQQANIFSKVNGNIERNFVDIGDRVSANQLLALIDTTIYSQNAKLAKANLMQAEANNENSKLNYDRNKKLFDQKLVAQQDLDNAKAAFDISVAQKAAAQATFNNAITQLSYCKITAPFAGTITKRFFDPGSYVSSTQNNQSSVLFVLMNVDHLKTIVNVPERAVPYLSGIKDVILTADAVPNKIFNARINRISQSIDLATRTMPVEIAIDNPGGFLKPGMFVTVQLITQKKINSEVIPTEVALNDDKGDYVFTLNPDTTVSKRYIKIGLRMDDVVEVLSGLNEKSKIVFVGQTLIKDKMKVKIAK